MSISDLDGNRTERRQDARRSDQERRSMERVALDGDGTEIRRGDVDRRQSAPWRLQLLGA